MVLVKRLSVYSVICALLFSGCASMSFNRHKVYAKNFTDWSENTARDLNELHEKADDEGKEWLSTKVNVVYDDAADMIESHTTMLKAWESAKEKPADIDVISLKIRAAILDIANLLIKFRNR